MKGRCYVNNTETLVEDSISKLEKTIAKILEVPAEILAPPLNLYENNEQPYERIVRMKLFIYYSAIKRNLELADMWISRKTSFKRYSAIISRIQDILSIIESFNVDKDGLIKFTYPREYLDLMDSISYAMYMIPEKTKINKRFIGYLSTIQMYSLLSSAALQCYEQLTNPFENLDFSIVTKLIDEERN